MLIRIGKDKSISLDHSGSVLLGSLLSLLLGLVLSSQKSNYYLILLMGIYFYEIYLGKRRYCLMLQILLECILLLTSTKIGMIIHEYL